MNKKITNILLLLSLAVLLFGSGFKIGEFKGVNSRIQKPSYNIKNINSSQNPNNKNIDFSLFWDTWDRVEQKFIDKDKIKPQKMVYGAIKGMVATLEDPYTFFLTPDENKQTKDELGGKFEGIGATLGLKDNRIVVIAPLKNSPAEVAGVRAGDYIVKVDGADTKGWTLPQAVQKIRGRAGTKVVLTVENNNKQKDVSITRREINVASVELSYEKNIAILKLNQFGQNTNDEWDKAVSEIKQKYDNRSVKTMVLDLRDNPGGYLDSAVYLASEFLKQGELIVKEESTTIESKDYYVTRPGVLQTIPLVIIINKGSASSSEILAGSVHDHKRAKIVGEKSFGKGSVQEAIDLEAGAGLHVTVAKWILPAGEWINGKGIEPDIKVVNELKNGDTLTRENDKQLDAAIGEVLK